LGGGGGGGGGARLVFAGRGWRRRRGGLERGGSQGGSGLLLGNENFFLGRVEFVFDQQYQFVDAPGQAVVHGREKICGDGAQAAEGDGKSQGQGKFSRHIHTSNMK
jgi:hypothetical protein